MDWAKIIFDKARADGMPVTLANFMVAQARHETKDFTSNVFRSCNNAFGYKYAGQKLSTGACTSAPEGGSYAAYRSLADSTHEITEWVKRRQAEGKFPKDLSTITNAEQYAMLLKKSGYYGDTVTNYTAGLLRFAANYGDRIAFGGLLVVGLTAWLLTRK